MDNNKSKLIQKILATKTKLRQGETLKINVKTNDSSGKIIHVAINGILGKEQAMQFSGPAGIRKILISAYTDRKEFDYRIFEVEILDSDDCKKFPIIQISNYYLDENCIECSVRNIEELKITNSFFEWDFGNNIKRFSETPKLIFKYEDYLNYDFTYQTFHLKLTTHDRSDESKFSIEQSFTVWNVYVVDKLKGMIRPRLSYDFHTIRENKMLHSSLNIRNLENEILYFTHKQIEFLYTDPEKFSFPNKPVRTDFMVAAKSSNNFDCNIPFETYPKDCFGYAVHLSGRTNSGLKVYASAYFEYQTNFKQAKRINDKKFVTTLNSIKNESCKKYSNIISLSELNHYLEKKAITENSLIVKQDFSKRITTLFGNETHIMEGNIESYVGQECIADEEPPFEDLVCQMTDEWAWVFIPSKIVNARKGDVVLSPSGNGAIGGLLKQVSPPQMYSHSGLMIQNFYKLRHSTGSEEWLADAAVGKFITGDAGSEGVDPDKLKYFWPGTIDQTIDQAFNGSLISDPDNLKDDNGNVKQYNIQAFDSSPKLSGNVEIIYPVVVKPNPLIEAENSQIREQLHKVAEEGKKINGHYRFYCYTEANISLTNFSNNYKAPDKGSGWWASNTVPTVCSSFIWASAKAVLNPTIKIEGSDFFSQPSDIEASDIGAEVDFKTIDGLYYYSEEERRAAAIWLHQHFKDVVFEKMDEQMGKVLVWFTNAFSDAQDDMADQICNTFAFDWSGEDSSGNHSKDSNKWENPGDGRAVSPNNIKSYWDEPKMLNDNLIGLYGYSENLIYRPARIEWRKVSRWVKVKKNGKLKGTVIYRGNLIAGAIVKVAGKDMLSDHAGKFEFTVSSGNFLIEAGKLIDGFYMEGSNNANVTAGSTLDITIELKEPPDWFREVVIRGTMWLKDEENWPDDDEYATRYNLFPVFRIGAFSTHAEGGWTEKMGGEVRAEVSIKLDWDMRDSSVNVWCNVKLFEGTSEDTGDLDGEKTEVHNIPKDTIQEIRIFVRNDDEDDDDHVDLSLIVSNNRQP